MLLATGVRRAWLEQTDGTYLPVLIVRHCQGSDMCISAANVRPLTRSLEMSSHLRGTTRQRRVTQSTLNRINREWDNRERLIWESADHDQLRQLAAMGHRPATSKSAVRLQKALVRHEAKTQRDAAKAAQQAEVDRRRLIREERKRARAEREAEAPKPEPVAPLLARPAASPEPAPKPEPLPKPEPVRPMIDFKIEALIRQIQQQQSVVAA